MSSNQLLEDWTLARLSRSKLLPQLLFNPIDVRPRPQYECLPSYRCRGHEAITQLVLRKDLQLAAGLENHSKALLAEAVDSPICIERRS